MNATRAEAFCESILPRVSRTFALGITMLTPDLRGVVTIAYLICRVADALEDDTASPLDVRREALAAWRADVLAVAARAGGSPLGVPRALIPELPPFAPRAWPASLPRGTSDADGELLVHRNEVLTAFGALAPDVRTLVGAYSAEMANGMAIYAQGEGARAIETATDLDRYCYYVAGTVGRMLTGLFTAGDPAIAPARINALEAAAEGFGEALQLVNIIKDAASDLREGRCYVPRDMWHEHDGREALHAALVQLSDRALVRCDSAQRYLLALPVERLATRQFCALALHLALLTLGACRTSPSLADADRPVKILRAQVADVATWLAQHAGDDAALQERYEALLPQR